MRHLKTVFKGYLCCVISTISQSYLLQQLMQLVVRQYGLAALGGGDLARFGDGPAVQRRRERALDALLHILHAAIHIRYTYRQTNSQADIPAKLYSNQF